MLTRIFVNFINTIECFHPFKMRELFQVEKF